jgi:hypothetical protein
MWACCNGQHGPVRAGFERRKAGGRPVPGPGLPGGSQRFHFTEWDHAITRKLAVTEGIYQKLSDRSTARRLEVLEWIVILLIALDVAASFFGLGQK